LAALLAALTTLIVLVLVALLAALLATLALLLRILLARLLLVLLAGAALIAILIVTHFARPPGTDFPSGIQPISATMRSASFPVIAPICETVAHLPATDLC
jgi:membrane protease YdiL (CAAX protease family)